MSRKVTRVGVLSDTHFHSLKEFPLSLLGSLKTFDLVIHLGDFVSPELVEYFRSWPNFYGIAGNHDPHVVKAVLPKADVVEINGQRLGLLHGYWFPFFCDHRSFARFKKEQVNAILYGHTHIIRNERVNDILMFNPGSASALWPAPWKTYGALSIGESISSEIVSITGEIKNGFSRYAEGVVSRSEVIRWVCGSPRFPDYSEEVK